MVKTLKTLEEAIIEIQGIINNTHWVETRLQQLKAKGYQIEECWVKNGDIGTVWYLRRKKIYRIQVTASELSGEYHKAFCVVISFYDLAIQISETTRMRTIPISKEAREEWKKSGM